MWVVEKTETGATDMERSLTINGGADEPGTQRKGEILMKRKLTVMVVMILVFSCLASSLALACPFNEECTEQTVRYYCRGGTAYRVSSQKCEKDGLCEYYSDYYTTWFACVRVKTTHRTTASPHRHKDVHTNCGTKTICTYSYLK